MTAFWLFARKVWIAALIGASVGAAAQERAIVERKTVLITTFDRWLSPVNSGRIVADQLKKRTDLKEDGIDLVTCDDLSSDDGGGKSAFAGAMKCLAKMKKMPDMVISLGEGACDLRLETRFHNVDNFREIIDFALPPEIPSTLPLAEMYCAVDSKKVATGPLKVRASIDAGFTACNNLSVRLGKVMKEKRIPYGFIHLPLQAPKCAKNLLTLSTEHIAKMLIAAVTSMRKSVTNELECIQPISFEELEGLITDFKTIESDDCRRRFYLELQDRYSSSKLKKN